MNKVGMIRMAIILFFIHCFTGAVSCSKDSGQSDVEKEESDSSTNVTSKTIEWDNTTLVKVAAPPTGSSYAGYARLTELDDGQLLCVYEADGNIWQVISNDQGKSWQDARVIAEKEDGINMAVPDILQLQNGSLLLMYNPRPYNIDPSRLFAIRVKISADDGATWGEANEIYKAGYQFENGCWEPGAIQLPDGTIQLYFANEGVYTGSDEQNISMLTSADNGQTWSSDPKIISFRAGKRDGMPVPLLLKGNARIAVAIEDNGFVNFKPYIITNTLEENWQTTVLADSPNRICAMATPVSNQVYAGAPYLRQLSTGETILSYQGTENRSSNLLDNAVMKVMVGDSLARNFTGRTEPFTIPGGKYGLWNSIAVLKDDTIIALTSTNGFSSSGYTEVWMIKGKLMLK
ncbi:MAG: sialidase family protein [Niabella sp.]